MFCSVLCAWPGALVPLACGPTVSRAQAGALASGSDALRPRSNRFLRRLAGHEPAMLFGHFDALNPNVGDPVVIGIRAQD